MTAGTFTARAIDQGFMMKAFYAFAAIALLALAINLLGHHYGRGLARGGHSADLTEREIVIGNDVIVTPDNTIRYDGQRHDGVAERLDLYFRWPDMSGYTDAASDDFNAVDNRRTLVFVTLEQRVMSRDMTGRLEPIYRSLIVEPGTPGDGGVMFFDFSDKSGYLGDQLAVRSGGTDPLVARCLPADAETLAGCDRDIQVGTELSLTYRFPRERIAEWPAIETAIRARALEIIRTPLR